MFSNSLLSHLPQNHVKIVSIIHTNMDSCAGTKCLLCHVDCCCAKTTNPLEYCEEDFTTMHL